MAGYEVTFPDFQLLLSYGGYRSVIAPLLRNWYGYEIVGEGKAVTVRAATGDAVDIERLHQDIQADPERQYTLYQRAMDVWR